MGTGGPFYLLLLDWTLAFHPVGAYSRKTAAMMPFQSPSSLTTTDRPPIMSVLLNYSTYACR
jgi:hypothetical protein